MTSVRGTKQFNEYLYSLSSEPQAHAFFSTCEVNGVKFMTCERDCKSTTTQNSGVMVETDDEKYYGVIEDVINLMYPNGVNCVIFKCRWFNENKRSLKRDHGIESVDTSQSWYEDTPYCLASLARQVFYIDDPVLGDNWKVINTLAQRGIYNVTSLSNTESAYQEASPSNIPKVPIRRLHVDLGSLPRAPPEFSVQNVNNVDSEDEFEDDEEEEDQNVDIENDDEDNEENVEDDVDDDLM